MRESKYEAKELEDTSFSSAGVTVDQLRRIGAEGTRRFGRLIPDISVLPHNEGITLSFTLPAGGYATAVLREFMKNDNMPEVEAEVPNYEEDP